MAESPFFIESGEFAFARYVKNFLQWPLFNRFDRRDQHSMLAEEVEGAGEVEGAEVGEGE